MELLRHVSFVDCPGEELLVVAADFFVLRGVVVGSASRFVERVNEDHLFLFIFSQLFFSLSNQPNRPTDAKQQATTS